MSWAEKAVERISVELPNVKGDRYADAMKRSVAETLKDFCRQDEEFAQAVVQGGTFPECMAAVAKGCGNSISDEEAYAKAVRFYFPGAKIKVSMVIDLVGDAADSPAPGRGIVLDLADFLV